MQKNFTPFWALPVVLACATLGGGAQAATDIADVPLITSASVTQVPPNLMFVLDDSGSMASAYMPDDMSDTSTYGYYSSQCNGLAFNPNLTYSPPVKDDKTSYGDSSFSSAWTDGYAQTGSTNLGAWTADSSASSYSSSSSVTIGTGSKTFVLSGSGYSSSTFSVGQQVIATNSSSRYVVGTVTSWTSSTKTLVVNVTATSGSGSQSSWSVSKNPLGVNTYYTYNSSGSQTAMNWTYQASGSNVGNVDTSTTFYKECMSAVGSTPGSNVFTLQYINNQSAAVQQNYANWYSYYRTRTMLMRTAVGRALKDLDGTYNVGFSTINSSRSTPAVTSSGFQPLGAFTGTQRSNVYTKLYGAAASGNTPLRGALSTMGRYYAGKYITSTVPDPIQYSCQRNYTLMTTDGYWNTGNESSSYGPYDLNGNSVGEQDATEAKPMWDGAVTTTTYSRNLYSATSTAYSDSACTKTKSATTYYYKVTTASQTSTDNVNWTTVSSSTSCKISSAVIYGSSTASSLANNPVASAVTTSTNVTGGSSNSLADIAEYYYKNDLRATGGTCSSTSSGTTQNVCADNVPTSGRDTANWQHMTTFTVGLGVNGTLAYDPNYLTQTSGSYVNLTNGTATWPVPQETTNGGDARQIDDLWHAAVNGRGQYYSALNATQLSSAIQSVLNTITAQRGASSAATTSTLNLIAGDNNKVYGANYVTANWTGDLKSFTLNGTTGAITTQSDDWSAQAKLTATAYTNRKIYYRKPSTGALTLFNWTNLNTDGLGSNFSGLCTTKTGVTQCSNGTLNSSEQTAASDGATLVNYLSGDRANEAANAALTPATTQAIYRKRVGEKGDNQGVLGDIIDGAPVYVGKPNFPYSDTGYSTFASTNSTRKPVIYVGANDGMLHAISAGATDGGTELWAYVPTAVMPYMYQLADSGYATKHRYFVDGAPVMGDVYINGKWSTILVGGLGKGGNSYYALDITDPSAPVLLWEFTDTNMGMTFGNPVITKRADGTWVVVFASGYNNADGQGHLYVVDAAKGTKLLDISTGAGSASNPSGLAKINGWIDNQTDNTSKRFYGADLLGNLWRFDIDGLVQPNKSALLLAKFQLNGTTPQPVTTQPRLTKVSNRPVIIVGTGRYLGTSDITDTTQQSLYAIKDSLTNTSLGDVRQNNTLVKQTFTASGTTATITNNQVNWNTNNGWWVDLPHSGERVATADIAMIGSVLSIATAIPSGDACQAGGASWNYFLNVSNGGVIQNIAGGMVSDSALIVGQGYVVDANGTPWIVRQMSNGAPPQLIQPPSGSSSNITPQRTSWRELVN